MTLPEGMPLAALVLASLASGIARGFSGFGAALVFMPLAAFAIGPRLAAPLLLVIDFVPMILLLRGAWGLADKAEVGWLSLGVLLGLPLGIAALALADPLALRWLVAGVILALLVLAASGLRFPATPHRGAAVGVGS
ncbi:MAG: sulfite exporter TauE/SafE family protein, partial [Roseomonas sp.]|nr:sulfite exporter TauE/SafE family protein [Roseomonas sp.]